MSSGSSRARLVARMLRARARGRPHTLSHLVTSRCNGRCPTCLWRGDGSDDLDTATVRWLYAEAGGAGLSQLVVWGGEPLLRDDLPELLEAAGRAGLFVTLITNGWSLAERWSGLRGHVDTLILSLDDDGPAHDRLRGLPGLFERLDAFAASLPRDPLRPTLLVNTVLSRENRGALARVAPVTQRWGAGLYFCPMETGAPPLGAGAGPLADLALPPQELRAAAREARALKARGYPILNTRAYIDLLERDPRMTGYRCRVPQSLLTVQADGGIRDCIRRDRPLAEVRTLRAAGRPLAHVFDLPRRRELLREADRCTACNNPDVVEISWLWRLRPALLGKVAELAAR